LYKFIGEVQVHDDLLLGLLIFMRLWKWRWLWYFEFFKV
jgi:hypothetical protein